MKRSFPATCKACVSVLWIFVYAQICQLMIKSCPLHDSGGVLSFHVVILLQYVFFLELVVKYRHIIIGRSNWKSAVEHAQHAQIQIILQMRKILSCSWISNDTLFGILWFWKRTAKALIILCVFTRRHVFACRDPNAPT